MPPLPDGKIYSATYSNVSPAHPSERLPQWELTSRQVPVYEANVAGNHVMRRRADDWINATHILKVADFDKPARTRILEREVQKGIHEKVQGGYGKYQGTWIPLVDGRALAERNGVLDKLLPIFDYVPGDRSPPPAPKHATAATNRARAPRQPPAQRRNGNNLYSLESINSFLANSQSQISEDRFEDSQIQPQHYRDETPDNETVVSESMLGDPDMMNTSQYSIGGRKRKRGMDQISIQDQQHQIWADALLDYFMLLDSDEGFIHPPEPPANVNLDRNIDEKGHSAMHWAAAMGDVEVVRELIRRGARIDCLSNNLETPLMRGVMFTNNFDKNTMPHMIKIFQATVMRTDWFKSTVFHHIAATTSSSNKFLCARYYMDCIINQLAETWIPDEVTRLLNQQDQNGDTAVHIAARNGARKCVRSLLVTQYDSTTASHLMTTVAPTLMEKCKELAEAYEAELREKEAESVDAQRVVKARQADIEAIRKQVAEMVAMDRGLQNGTMEDEADRMQEEELRMLVEEAESLLEIEQRGELRQLCLQTPQPATSPVDLNEKMRFALLLHCAQVERRDLVHEVVSNLSVAGMGEKQGVYKSLIAKALGEREDEIESMLPEILKELEEAETQERADGLQASPM
ncbi:apses-domain-containing protein [Polyplosphaeria fusca]|uniref:Apses-domain-containing protein n=1 Tax=Polyplosphaeria fusca TaxID=682080 RepID=A0A9P4V6W1_9PLEO|nr:apses-domain-containing protein [Polyplosphaeria fusca]